MSGLPSQHKYLYLCTNRRNNTHVKRAWENSHSMIAVLLHLLFFLNPILTQSLGFDGPITLLLALFDFMLNQSSCLILTRSCYTCTSLLFILPFISLTLKAITLLSFREIIFRTAVWPRLVLHSQIYSQHLSRTHPERSFSILFVNVKISASNNECCN